RAEPSLFPYTTLFRSSLRIPPPSRGRRRQRPLISLLRTDSKDSRESALFGGCQPHAPRLGPAASRAPSSQRDAGIAPERTAPARSEEHTSELQSREHL